MNAGYCFVEFENSAVADTVLKKLNGLPVPGTNPVSRRVSITFPVLIFTRRIEECSCYCKIQTAKCFMFATNRGYLILLSLLIISSFSLIVFISVSSFSLIVIFF